METRVDPDESASRTPAPASPSGKLITARHWSATLKGNLKGDLKGFARALTYDDVWETGVENLRTFVESIVNVALKPKNHRYWETHPWSVGLF